ncbi:MAG: DUF5069 domain-containing protein [Nitrospiria bacterium]
MKIKALDLSKEYPRSPREKLGGYVHLARMIDKARAKATGTLGEYIYPCPLDQLLLELLNISNEAFYEAVKERDDGEILDWLKMNGEHRSPEEVKNWNQAFLSRKPQSEEGMRHFLEIQNKFAPHRTDITTWVDLLDLEEGRAQEGAH